MYTIEISRYPRDKEWSQKANSTPSIPGGKSMALSNLRRLLLAVEQGDPMEKVPQLDESSSKSTLQELCVHQLSAVGLVRRSDGGRWTISDGARLWLDSEDHLYLAAFFSANVKYFAEILYYLDAPKTARELFEIAVNEYDLAWKLPSTVNSRLVWLRQFGLIEFREFSLLYHITEQGKRFLSTVNPVMPDSLLHGEDDTAAEAQVVIGAPFIEYLCDHKSAARKQGFGYLPGNMKDFAKTIEEILTKTDRDGSIESIDRFASASFGIKGSSTRSALSTLSLLGLIERRSNTAYAVTDLGHLWMEHADPIHLLPLLQLRYLFVLEMLAELKDTSLTARELATLAKVSYRFDKESVSEINHRLAVFRSAKLIMNVSAEKFTLTHRGRLLLEAYGKLLDGKQREAVSTREAPSASTDIIAELRMASKDSYNPSKFERTVKDFFELLGFASEWLGGSGKTDVLVRTPDSPHPFTVSVDAKATASGTVTDALVDFDTLKEHRTKHRADYIAVVGRGFNERVLNRAKEHGVLLLDIDTLEELLRIHRCTPQKACVYEKVFAQSGRADLSVLESFEKKTNSMGELLVRVMKLLIGECLDPVTKGQLSVRDLYMSLRNDPSLSSPPSIEDIETVLDFLSCPIIGCVTRERDYYYATGSLGDMTNMLDFLRSKTARA